MNWKLIAPTDLSTKSLSVFGCLWKAKYLFFSYKLMLTETAHLHIHMLKPETLVELNYNDSDSFCFH